MENKKTGFEGFMAKLEEISDMIVWKVYSEWLMNQIESLDLMKKLVNSAFVKWLHNFWEGWFKQVFVFFWYLWIVWGAFGVITYFLNIFNYFWSGIYLWLMLLWFVISFVWILLWVWMTKFKKWVPFLTLVQSVLYMFSSIFAYYILSNSFYGKLYGGSIVNLSIQLCFSILITAVVLALLIRNKDLFSWKVVVKQQVKEETNTETKREL